MPGQVLWGLAALALCFCAYSLTCHFFLKGNFRPFLKGIMAANLLYCVLTASLIVIHFDSLSEFGIAYFVGEIGVIVLLVALEYRILKSELGRNLTQSN